MKMYLIGAAALSTTVTMATAEIEFVANFSQAYNEGFATALMASDYDADGTATDYSGNARLSHSHSTQLNGSNMDITMRVDTIGGVSFRESVMSWEQTQYSWDGTEFQVGSLQFDFGNYFLGQYGIGSQNGIDVGSEWEDQDGTTAVTYFFADGVSRSYVVDTAPQQIYQAAADLTEFFTVYGLIFDGSYEDDYVHGDAIAIEITETVALVPAPGALALLGLGGLAARRRRG